MGLIFADLELRNPSKPSLKPIVVKALVDTGASYMCLPQYVANQLQLAVDTADPDGSREVETADGSTHVVPYIGPLNVRFDNRKSYSGALLMGDEPLLGAITMQDLDVVVSPMDETTVVNPRSPNIARGKAKLSSEVSSEK